MSGPEKRAIRTCHLALLLLWFAVADSAVADINGKGAIPSNRLTWLIQHTLQEPGKRDTPVTFIVESNAAADAVKAIIASAGGSVRFHFENRYEVRISAARVQRLLMQLPTGSRARLSWPHQAVWTTSQGVELTGANDMQLPTPVRDPAEAVTAPTSPRSCTIWRPARSCTWRRSTPTRRWRRLSTT